MNIALWVIAGLLALMFLMAGTMKLRTPIEEMHEKMAWTRSTPTAAIRALGTAEILGAIGLILPAAVNIAPILTPIAASGLAIVALGAAVVHLRAGEGMKAASIPLLLGVLSVLVAVLRFGPYAF